MKAKAKKLLEAIPADCRDGLVNVEPYIKGWKINYAPGSADEIQRAFKALGKAFPNMYRLMILGDGAGIYVAE